MWLWSLAVPALGPPPDPGFAMRLLSPLPDVIERRAHALERAPAAAASAEPPGGTLGAPAREVACGLEEVAGWGNSEEAQLRQRQLAFRGPPRRHGWTQLEKMDSLDPGEGSGDPFRAAFPRILRPD